MADISIRVNIDSAEDGRGSDWEYIPLAVFGIAVFLIMLVCR